MNSSRSKKSAPANPRTYGNKGPITARPAVQNITFHTAIDNDHPEFSSSQGRLPLHDLQPTSSNIQVEDPIEDESDVGAKKRLHSTAIGKTKKPKASKPEKKQKNRDKSKESLSEILSDSNIADIKYLKDLMDKYLRDWSSNKSHCLVKRPTSWSVADLDRFDAWAPLLGFKEKPLSTGEFNFELESYEEIQKVLKLLDIEIFKREAPVVARDRSYTQSSRNSSHSSIAEDPDLFNNRSRNTSDAVSTLNALTIDTELLNPSRRGLSTFSGVSSRAGRMLRSRTVSIDQFDNDSPYGPHSSQPSPFQFSASTSPRYASSTTSGIDAAESGRQTTESPSTVQVVNSFDNLQLNSVKKPIPTNAVKRGLQSANSMYLSSTLSSYPTIYEDMPPGPPLKRSMSMTENPPLTQSILAANQRTMDLSHIKQDRNDDTHSDASDKTILVSENADDYIHDPDADLVLLDVNLTDGNTYHAKSSPPFRTQTQHSPIRAIPTSSINLASDLHMPEPGLTFPPINSVGQSSTSYLPAISPSYHPQAQASTLSNITSMLSNTARFVGLLPKTDHFSPISSDNGNFSKVPRQSSATTTSAIALAAIARQQQQDHTSTSLSSTSAPNLTRAQTMPLNLPHHHSNIHHPRSPTHQERVCLSQNDMEVYSTPQSLPPPKTTSGVGYDWALTEKACPKICTRLLQKYTSSHDDNDAIRNGRSYHHLPTIDAGPTRLTRSYTTGNVSDDVAMLRARLSSNQLFHMEHHHGSTSSNRPNDIISSNNDIISLSSIIENYSSSMPSSSLSSSIQRSTSFQGRTNDSLSFHTGLKSIAESSSSQHHTRASKNLTRSRQKWNRMSMSFKHHHKKNTSSSSLEESIMSTSSSSHNNIVNDDSIHMDHNSSHHNISSHRLSLSSSSSLSPAVGTKYRTSTNYRLRYPKSSHQNTSGLLKAHHPNLPGMNIDDDDDHDDDQRDGDDQHDDACDDIMSNHTFTSPRIMMHHHSSSHGSTMMMDDARKLSAHHNVDEHFNNIIDLNEFNFHVNIIGGTYQQSFQDTHPIIAPPASSENRVVGIHYSISDASLALRIYYPAFKTEKLVLFSSSWTWIIAKPVGCIICDDAIVPGKKCHGYFILQHPSDWHDHSPLRRDHSTSLYDRLVSHRHSDSHISDANTSFISTSSHHRDHHHHMASSSHNISIADDNELAMNISLNDHSGIMQSSSEQGQDDHNLSSDSIPMAWNDHHHHIIPSSHPISSMDDSIDTIDPEDAAMISSSCHSHWTNLSIISWVLDYLLEYDASSSTSSSASYMFVCKTWALASLRHYASYKSQSDHMQMMSRPNWISSMMKYQWKFLGEGACKKVYHITQHHHKDYHHDNTSYAMSIVDIIDMQERDMEDAINQELTISMICSSLYSLNICPNLVRIYSLFQASSPPSDHHRISSSSSTISSSSGKYQYVRMEFCEGGDVDEMIIKMRTIDASMIRIYLFQMFFALYACREQLALRHYDIKLLNFLATSSRSLIKHPSSSSYDDHHDDDIIQLCIGFGQYIYHLPLSSSSCKYELIKLTDFGTSMIGAGGLGDPITVAQFTTLENTPIEFFLLGSDARQAYSADTYSLGLSMMHMMIGYDAYENLMKDVSCPLYMMLMIQKYWEQSHDDSVYHVIHEVISSLDTSDDDQPGIILYHTIYRYMVLFSSCDDMMSQANIIYASSPIWCAMIDALNLSCDNSNYMMPKRVLRKHVMIRDEAHKTFDADRKMWNIVNGQHHIMKEFRGRMSALGQGSFKLLEKLIHFDPARRCSLHEAILSPVFDPLRSTHHHHNNNVAMSLSQDDHDDSHDDVKDDDDDRHVVDKISYMHYYRSDRIGADGLPML